MEILNEIIKNQELDCSNNTKSKNCDLIHFLAKNSNEEILFEFLKLYLSVYPEKVNLKNEEGWTSLIIASRNSNTTSSVETVELLLKNGADPNLKNNKFWSTALMLASSIPNTTFNTETVELLLKNGADPNIQNKNGWTALMIACCNSFLDSNLVTVKLLLEYNSNPNLKDNDGKNVCDRFFEGHPELLKKNNCDKEEIISKITDLLKSL